MGFCSPASRSYNAIRGLGIEHRPGRLSPPPALAAFTQHRCVSVSPFQQRQRPRRRQPPSPANTAVPGLRGSLRQQCEAELGRARPGAAERVAVAAAAAAACSRRPRHGPPRAPRLPAPFRERFCKSHKMARAPNLRNEKRRGRGGGGGGGLSARKVLAARPPERSS